MQTSSRTCSTPQAGLVERALEVRQRARLVHAGVDEHDPVARGERPGVAVRHARPGQRQPQAPDAGQDALAAADLAVASGLAHGARIDAVHACAPAAQRRSRRRATYFDALAARDVEAMAALWAPGRRGAHRRPGRRRRPRRRARRTSPSCSRRSRTSRSTSRRPSARTTSVAVHWKATAHVTGPLSGPRADRRADRHRGDRPAARPRRADRRATTRCRTGWRSPARSACVPPAGSAAEQRMFAAFNARTTASRRAVARGELERVADGVWLVRGGVPRTMNVYLLEDEGGGVTLFDAGIRQMTHAVATAAAPLGGIKRVVLGHADADHRGAAPGLGVPVLLPPGRARGRGGRRRQRDYHRRSTSCGIPARCGLPAAARVLGRRAGGDRRHGRRGRRGRGLPRRAPARARAGADRRCSARATGSR